MPGPKPRQYKVDWLTAEGLYRQGVPIPEIFEQLKEADERFNISALYTEIKRRKWDEDQNTINKRYKSMGNRIREGLEPDPSHPDDVIQEKKKNEEERFKETKKLFARHNSEIAMEAINKLLVRYMAGDTKSSEIPLVKLALDKSLPNMDKVDIPDPIIVAVVGEDFERI